MLCVFFMMLGSMTGCQKQQAESTQKPDVTITWIENFDQAVAIAKAENKPVMVYFMATWCPECKKLEATTLIDQVVIDKTHSFIPVWIDVDQYPDIANQHNGNAGKYGGVGIPNILFLDPNGTRLQHVIGSRTSAELIAIMEDVLANR